MILVFFVRVSHFNTLSWQLWLVSTFKFWQFCDSAIVQLWKPQDWLCLRRRLGHRPRPRRRGWIYQSWLPYSDWPKPRISYELPSIFVWSNEKWPYKRTDLMNPTNFTLKGLTWDHMRLLNKLWSTVIQYPILKSYPNPGEMTDESFDKEFFRRYRRRFGLSRRSSTAPPPTTRPRHPRHPRRPKRR